MKRLMLAGLGLLLVNIAHAADWVVVGGGSGESGGVASKIIAYIDKSRIEKIGRFTQYWEKNVSSIPIPATHHPGKFVSTFLDLHIANCAAKTDYIKSETLYDSDDAFIATDGPFAVHFDPVVPDSIGEAVLNYVCKPAKPKIRYY